MPQHHQDAGCQCCNSIQISPQNRRCFIHENVTQYSAADSSQHPHDCGHHGVQSRAQGLLRTGNGEQSQTCAIEQQHRPAPHVYAGIPQERGQSSQDTDSKVTPIADGCMRNGLDKQVADDSACASRGEGKHHQPEQIQLALYAGCCTTECEDEGPKQVERKQKGAGQVSTVTQNVIHGTSQAEAATTRAFTPVSIV